MAWMKSIRSILHMPEIVCCGKLHQPALLSINIMVIQTLYVYVQKFNPLLSVLQVYRIL